jgi:hypothetical protein
LFFQGIRTFNPGLVRRSLSLWWNDCSASEMGKARDGLTVHLLDAPNIRDLDHSKIRPGDLAVTKTGVHVLAYIGDETCIEADPEAGRVISIRARKDDNPWFDASVDIVRWSALAR